MANTTQICNKALALVGASFITDINDDSNEARLCKSQFDILRDELLEEGEWSFAIKREALPARAEAPANHWVTMYAFPSSAIRILECSYDPNWMTPLLWAVETDADGSKVIAVRRESGGRADYFSTAASPGGPLQVKYIFRQEEPSRFTSLFTEAFATRLAAELAIPLAQSAKLEGLMRTRAEQKLAIALATDAIGAGRSKRLRSSSLTRVR